MGTWLCISVGRSSSAWDDQVSSQSGMSPDVPLTQPAFEASERMCPGGICSSTSITLMDDWLYPRTQHQKGTCQVQLQPETPHARRHDHVHALSVLSLVFGDCVSSVVHGRALRPKPAEPPKARPEPSKALSEGPACSASPSRRFWAPIFGMRNMPQTRYTLLSDMGSACKRLFRHYGDVSLE